MIKLIDKDVVKIAIVNTVHKIKKVEEDKKRHGRYLKSKSNLWR